MGTSKRDCLVGGERFVFYLFFSLPLSVPSIYINCSGITHSIIVFRMVARYRRTANDDDIVSSMGSHIENTESHKLTSGLNAATFPSI